VVARKRHFAKAVSWRIIGTLDTMIIGWLVTGDPLTGAAIGAFEVFSKLFLYYGHERAWYKLSKFGVDKK
tara:strand:- start:1150 stop:1359 length:210 start_codon:yes stop_codon:yes gene_type:complete